MGGRQTGPAGGVRSGAGAPQMGEASLSRGGPSTNAETCRERHSALRAGLQVTVGGTECYEGKLITCSAGGERQSAS